MSDGRGQNPNSQKNLNPIAPGEKRRKGIRARQTRIKQIIRELLECQGYAKLVANKALSTEVAALVGVEELNGKELIVLAQIQKALVGDTKAFNALMDRMEGKPAQFIENSNKGMSYTDFLNSIDDDEEGEDYQEDDEGES